MCSGESFPMIVSRVWEDDLVMYRLLYCFNKALSRCCVRNGGSGVRVCLCVALYVKTIAECMTKSNKQTMDTFAVTLGRPSDTKDVCLTQDGRPVDNAVSCTGLLVFLHILYPYNATTHTHCCTVGNKRADGGISTIFSSLQLLT